MEELNPKCWQWFSLGAGIVSLCIRTADCKCQKIGLSSAESRNSHDWKSEGVLVLSKD